MRCGACLELSSLLRVVTQASLKRSKRGSECTCNGFTFAIFLKNLPHSEQEGQHRPWRVLDCLLVDRDGMEGASETVGRSVRPLVS